MWMNALKWTESVITIVSMFGGHISVHVNQDLPLQGITGMWKVCSNIYLNFFLYILYYQSSFWKHQFQKEVDILLITTHFFVLE